MYGDSDEALSDENGDDYFDDDDKKTINKNKSQTSSKVKLNRRKSVCTDASSNERASIFTANINASLDTGLYDNFKGASRNIRTHQNQKVNKKMSMVK